MKKFTIFMVCISIFVVSGCSNKEYDTIDGLEGRYYMSECIYLTVFSSSTLEAYTAKYQDIGYIEFLDDQVIYFNGDEKIKTYDDIKYIKEDVDQDLDHVIPLDFDDIFEEFDDRYDIYSNDYSIGLTLFFSGNSWYIAETKMIGGSHDVFTVWTIFEINKQI